MELDQIVIHALDIRKARRRAFVDIDSKYVYQQDEKAIQYIFDCARIKPEQRQAYIKYYYEGTK